MGVSWLLRCTKCHESYKQLYKLAEEHDLDIEPCEMIKADFYLFELEKSYREENRDKVDELLSWIKTHREHGDIEFTGE